MTENNAWNIMYCKRCNRATLAPDAVCPDCRKQVELEKPCRLCEAPTLAPDRICGCCQALVDKEHTRRVVVAQEVTTVLVFGGILYLVGHLLWRHGLLGDTCMVIGSLGLYTSLYKWWTTRIPKKLRKKKSES